MLPITVTLALLLCQDPTPPAAAPATRSVITLRGGEQIVGTILKQVGNYIEVRLDASTVVGFERSRVSRIESVQAPASKPPALTPRDEWFLLHDALGNSAGYMHALVQTAADGSLRVSEEWCFATESGRTQVTMLDTLDGQLRPQTTFYHERVLSKRDRLEFEQLVTGEVDGDKLIVETRNLKGRERREYPFRDNVQFPLSYRARLREDTETLVVSANQELFDARTGEFLVWKTSTVARRKVELHGKKLTVREITLDNGSRANSEWIDANHRVLRREVNGASLVAVRVDQARALNAVKRKGPTGFEPAVATTGSGDMALWLPNPVWTPGSKGASRVSIKAELYSGTATLMALDQIPANVSLATAADTLVRWLKLTRGTGIDVRARDGVQVQRVPAIRIRTRWSVERQGESVPWTGVCHVFRVRERYAVLFCAAPRDNFGDLERDFQRILDSVQLDRQDVAPTPQGPKAKRRR